MGIYIVENPSKTYDTVNKELKIYKDETEEKDKTEEKRAQ